MKKVKKFILATVLLLLLVSGLLILFSPYHSENGLKRVEHTIIINAPAAFVFDYLGNSENARVWSVFVDHITTLNGDQIEDGLAGSMRRCFVEADEQGMYWDEEILEVVSNKKRRLSIINMQGFPMSAKNLETEQIYVALDEGKCQLSLTLFFRPEMSSLVDHLKLYFAAYKVKSIFAKNLDNIKLDVEKKFKSTSQPNLVL